ncbi:MAG: ion transporter [Longimicrobiales bacterium]|nr:ion transporter [Longimicrobiales bacterium]
MPPFGSAAPPNTLRGRTYQVIFGHEEGAPQVFDGVLMVAILGSVVALMLDSVAGIRAQHGPALRAIEWGFTLLFSVEYALRIWCVKRKWAYMRSFFGVIDLLSVLPTYISFLLPGGQFLVVVRILRILRVFRVFKLVRFLGEANVLATALRNSRYKISVFLVTVVCVVVVVGSVMFVVEGPQSGFTSIPRGVYWAIVTLTTVGYGDIAPTTAFGQALAAFVMILGYGIIAVPTGIVTAELSRLPPGTATALARECPECERIETDPDASYCRFCGAELPGDSVA